MKMLKSAIAVAVASLAVAGVAEAKIQTVNDGSGNGSEFVLSLWNKTDIDGYNLDLGFTMGDFLSDTSGYREYTVSSATDSNFASFAANYAAGKDVRWNVAAANTVLVNPAVDALKHGILMTTNTATTSSAFQTYFNTNTKIGNAGSQLGLYIISANSGSGEAAGDVTTNASDFQDLATDAGYVGAADWGQSWGGKAGTINTMAAIGEALDFRRASTTASNTRAWQQFDQWNFNISTDAQGNAIGKLSYGVPTAVPVPAAAWMFLSGLMGTLAATRRKHAA